MRHSQYTAYFRSLATNLKSISHSPEEMHFARVIRTQDPFARLDLEEFLQAARNKMKFPFLLLETYDSSLMDRISDNKWELFEGGVILLEKATKGNFDSIEAALDKTEMILKEELLPCLYHDYKQKRVEWHLDLNDVSFEKVGPVGDYLVGTRLNFILKVTANRYLKFNPDLLK